MLNPLTGRMIDPNNDSINAPIDERLAGTIAVSDLLMAIGKGLFLVFLGYAIVDSLPFQLLNPSWQLAFAARLLSLGSIPLVGFGCIHLAVIVNPANQFYRLRLVSLRKWAMVAALGFLLMIPLHGYASWRAYTDAKINQQTLIRQANRRIAPLKKAIESATSTADLQQRLSRVPGLPSRMTKEELALPLEEVRKAILNNLARSENLYIDRIKSTTGSTQIWSSLQSGARTLVASLGYFIGFAAGAQLNSSSPTLSDNLSLWFQSLFGRRRRRSSRT